MYIKSGITEVSGDLRRYSEAPGIYRSRLGAAKGAI